MPFDCAPNESKSAAYLGYGGVGDYRQYRFSYPVLYALQRYKQYKGAKRDYKRALEVINDNGINQVDP